MIDEVSVVRLGNVLYPRVDPVLSGSDPAHDACRSLERWRPNTDSNSNRRTNGTMIHRWLNKNPRYYAMGRIHRLLLT